MILIFIMIFILLIPLLNLKDNNFTGVINNNNSIKIVLYSSKANKNLTSIQFTKTSIKIFYHL